VMDGTIKRELDPEITRKWESGEYGRSMAHAVAVPASNAALDETRVRITDVRRVPDRDGFLHRGELGVCAQRDGWTVWGFGHNRASALRDAESKIDAAVTRYDRQTG